MIVVPPETPVTVPEELTVATAGLSLLHSPPMLPLDSAILLPWQMVLLPPFIGTGGYTVVNNVSAQPYPGYGLTITA